MTCVRWAIVSEMATLRHHILVDSSERQADNPSVDQRKQSTTLWLCWCILVVVVATGDKEACSQSLFEYVPNLPYTAQGVNSYLETLADGTVVRRETRVVQMRDSQGRTRIETFPPDGPGCNHRGDQPVMVNLYIPSRRQFIQLTVARKVARVMTLPGTGPTSHGTNLNAVETTTESLPGQLVHGIYAVGRRTTQRLPSDDRKSPDVVDVQESWISPELKIVVLSRHKSTDRRSDDAMWEIQKLDRSEPDPGLFEIPTDYKRVSIPAGYRGRIETIMNEPPGDF